MQPKQNFTIKPSDFAIYFASLPAQGFSITPTDANNGVAIYKDYGVKIGYQYIPLNSTLVLTGLSKDFISPPWSMIFSLVQEHLTQPLAANPPSA